MCLKRILLVFAFTAAAAYGSVYVRADADVRNTETDSVSALTYAGAPNTVVVCNPMLGVSCELVFAASHDAAARANGNSGMLGAKARVYKTSSGEGSRSLNASALARIEDTISFNGPLSLKLDLFYEPTMASTTDPDAIAYANLELGFRIMIPNPFRFSLDDPPEITVADHMLYVFDQHRLGIHESERYAYDNRTGSVLDADITTYYYTFPWTFNAVHRISRTFDVSVSPNPFLPPTLNGRVEFYLEANAACDAGEEYSCRAEAPAFLSAYPKITGNYTLGSGAAFNGFDDSNLSSVPEPATFALLGSGCVLLAMARRRRAMTRER